MVVQGKKGDQGYEEFDSAEFEEADRAFEKDEKDSKGDVDAKEEPEFGKKLTLEEAFGGEDKDKEEEVKADDAGADDDKSEETPDEDKAGQQEDKPAYEPNHKYTAYGQEKEFPEQLKKLVQDKDTEDYVRGLLSKADGLDEMKPRHQETVRERDSFKSEVDFYKNDINRILELRDKQPHLFAAELNLSDDWILKVAKQIVNAKATPEAWDQFNDSRSRTVETYNQQIEATKTSVAASQQFAAVHQQQMSMAMSHPDVSSFQSQFDSVHGLGAFQEEVRKQGFYHYEKTARTNNGRGENLAPMEAVKQVLEFHKKAFARSDPQGGEKPTEKKVVAAPRERPKPIPNIGKGRNVSPVGERRFKNLAEMRAYVDKHVRD